MTEVHTRNAQPVNQKRRNLLQGAALAGVASFAPAVFGNALSKDANTALSGKLICKLSDPVKTLVLRNNSNQAIQIDQVDQGAFMFDGSVVNCNAACVSSTITIPAQQEIQVQFNKRQQFSLANKVNEFNRIQSRVTRLGDGTRVIPFSATVSGNIATIV